MLAASAPTIEDALAKIAAGAGGERDAAVEWKLDGIRIQAHVLDGDVRLYTRTLDDITARLPEVIAELGKLPVRAAVLDGELIALRPDGRPYPFQDTSARVASEVAAVDTVPLSVFLFDALHLDGTDLIDLPDEERHAALASSCRPSCRCPGWSRIPPPRRPRSSATRSRTATRAWWSSPSPRPTRLGGAAPGWIKVKPRHTLDLVVLAVEWGHGRRKGGCPTCISAPATRRTGGWVMLGKTFKGLTDELLTWQTARLLELADHRDDWTVYVRPELVVEIAFDGVQRSPRYPGGVALRFARVAPLPRGQARRRGRHDRHGPRPRRGLSLARQRWWIAKRAGTQWQELRGAESACLPAVLPGSWGAGEWRGRRVPASSGGGGRGAGGRRRVSHGGRSRQLMAQAAWAKRAKRA